MAYIKVRQGENVAYSVSYYVCDTIDDVAKLPRSQMGSTVYVIAEKEKYIADSAGAWHPMVSSNPSIECDCVEESTIWETLPD
jgi:hypothetical protein